MALGFVYLIDKATSGQSSDEKNISLFPKQRRSMENEYLEISLQYFYHSSI